MPMRRAAWRFSSPPSRRVSQSPASRMRRAVATFPAVTLNGRTIFWPSMTVVSSAT